MSLYSPTGLQIQYSYKGSLFSNYFAVRISPNNYFAVRISPNNAVNQFICEGWHFTHI